MGKPASDFTDEQIVTALKAAEVAAIEAGKKNPEDGGTCNCDCPVLFLKGIRETRVEKLSKESGVSLSISTWLGSRCIFVRTTKHGQANLHSRMAEAAYKVLDAAGLPACFYQQMD